MGERLYLFTRFERFWHWSQATLIITLLFSGFAVHGSHALLEFRTAVEIHEVSAWLLMLLWVFGIFWHFTTGHWRQYIPTLNNIDRMLRYYVHGIFIGAPHPYNISVERKHNPLQRLSYLFVKVMIGPLLWLTGLLYLFWEQVQELLALVRLATGRTAAYGGRVHDADLPDSACVPGHNRADAPGTHQSHG